MRTALVSQFVASGVLIAAALFVTYAAGGDRLATVAQTVPTSCQDSCGLPAGLDLSLLSPGEREDITRRALLCADLSCGRISHDAYLGALAALDFRAPEIVCPAVPTTPVWATTVRHASSEYTADSWGAKQILGPPNVAVLGSDSADAWAPETEDGAIEIIEVGFEPTRASGLRLIESFNPGAVTRVELIFASGRSRTVYEGLAVPAGTQFTRDIQFSCNDEAVVAARIHLDSPAVPGWNEIDAVGLLPCGR